MLTVSRVVQYIEAFAPPDTAADRDNVGLLLGNQDSPVRKIMTCLTVTPASAAEAIAAGVNLIVTHHPILFRAVQRLTAGDAEGRMLLDLAQAGVAVYSPHTAFDNAVGGINDQLALTIGLVDVGPLRRREAAGECKLVVFVPEADLARVSDALFDAGAGRIGQYSQCSFRTAGTGTFFGSEASNPARGQKGRREEVAEWRLEAVCPEERVAAAITALRKAHSYEEPAYDVVPLRPRLSARGEGRIGRLPQPLSLESLGRIVKERLAAAFVHTVGDRARAINRVAIACGAGGEFLGDAVGAGADLLLTGEVRFHDCLSAEARGVALLLPGHYATERCGVESLAERLTREWPDVEVWASRAERDPLLPLT
jgi:dinuclear metal center YbgI/SA1388 family protein